MDSLLLLLCLNPATHRCRRSQRSKAWSWKTSCPSLGHPNLPSLTPMAHQTRPLRLPGPLLYTCRHVASRPVCTLIRKAQPPPLVLQLAQLLLCLGPLLLALLRHSCPKLQSPRTRGQRGSLHRTTPSLWSQVRIDCISDIDLDVASWFNIVCF